jgi:hypothetical protein
MQARLALAAAALSIIAAASGPASADPSTPVNCSAPRGIDDRRACEAARNGVASLRRFADATRRIYAIYVLDYLPTAQEADRMQGRAETSAETKLAAVK